MKKVPNLGAFFVLNPVSKISFWSAHIKEVYLKKLAIVLMGMFNLHN